MKKVVCILLGLVAACVVGLALLGRPGLREGDLSFPDEREMPGYFSALHKNTEAAVQALAAVQSRESAEDAVYALARIAADNRHLYFDLPLIPGTLESLPRQLQDTANAEARELLQPAYKRLLAEHARLKAQGFYGSQDLAYLVESYFIEETEGSRIVKFLPGARYRIARRLSQEAPIPDAISAADLRKAVDMKRIADTGSVSLVVLDALQSAGEHGRAGYAGIACPPYHAVRDENPASFAPVLSIHYYFHDTARKAQTPPDDLALWTGRDVAHLSLDAALASPHLAQSAELDDTKMVVLRTAAPFHSKYLVIRYENGSPFPTAFFFTSEVDGDTIRLL